MKTFRSPDEVQAELPLIAMLRAPVPVDGEIVEGFGELEDTAVVYAVRWSWDHRRIKALTQEQAAIRMGMKPQHLSCILKGTKYLPPAKINAFEWATGNTALSQTIRRFKEKRDREMADQLAKLISDNIVRAA